MMWKLLNRKKLRLKIFDAINFDGEIVNLSWI